MSKVSTTCRWRSVSPPAILLGRHRAARAGPEAVVAEHAAAFRLGPPVIATSRIVDPERAEALLEATALRTR